MNRREMFKRVTAATTALGAGVSVTALDGPVDPKSTLVVFKCEGRLPESVFHSIREEWQRLTHGTDWEGVRTVILDAGMSIEVYKR